MIQKIGRKTFRVFAYDVESHNDDESIKLMKTSIWLSCFIDETSDWKDEKSYFYTIEDFLDHLEDISTRHYHNKKRNIPNILIYVYNLSFEYSFLLPKMLSRGLKCLPSISKEDSYCFSSVTTKTCSSVWECRIKFKRTGGIVIFRDLAKIFGGGLGKVAKSFGLPTQKGIIDYRQNRLHGHIVTDEEKFYNFKDCRIVVDILLEMQRRDDKDFWKSLSTSSYSCRKMIRQGFTHTHKPMVAFRKLYPEPSPEEEAFLRKSVAGGITYAPTQWQYVDIKKEVMHIDLHSAHPSSAYLHPMPYGKGEYFKGKPKAGAFIDCLHIKISYSSVNLHSVIQLIGIDIVSNYDLWVWSFEIPLMMKCYNNLKIEYVEGYRYRRRFLPWRDYYKDCFEKRKIAKAKGDAFNTMFYKLLINSSYGKLLEKPHNTYNENIINANGVIDSIVKDKAEDEIRLSATYTALEVGSAIPARTRVKLVSTAMHLCCWDEKQPDGTIKKDVFHPMVTYFDTDSIFFIKTPDTMAKMKDLDFENHLGGWGIENTAERAFFSCPKRYKLIEKVGDHTEEVYHLAGINFNGDDLPSFDDLDLIEGDYDIQGSMRCEGGTIIVMKHKKLQVQDKYRYVFEQNKGKEVQ